MHKRTYDRLINKIIVADAVTDDGAVRIQIYVFLETFDILQEIVTALTSLFPVVNYGPQVCLPAVRTCCDRPAAARRKGLQALPASGDVQAATT